MYLVKIISGAYGYKDDTKSFLATRKTPPFPLDEKEAARLVKLGVAEILQTDAEPETVDLQPASKKRPKRKTTETTETDDENSVLSGGFPELEAQYPEL